MKLKDDFFKILDCSETDNKLEYRIQLNISHSIYSNHFPDNPVTPGVCLIQIIKELLADRIASEIILREASKIRYLKVINPLENSYININMDISAAENFYTVSATVFSNTDMFAKLSLKYEKLP
ncbi:MAG: hypothetical protein LBG92_05950 [Prevotellaceae bacterium]|jgi:3-hydroxyacyl-[acyl-carrier-protein] dehydratase|nr:hypothetical protein [Prevotellaceae bacterium]